MNISMSQAGIFRYASRITQSSYSYTYGQRQNGSDSVEKAQNVASIRRMLSESRETEQNATYSSRTAEGPVSYGDAVRTARKKAKDTALKLKKLRYNFKSISSQILRSKTSVSAKQVAGKARREVIRLKRQRMSSEYDQEDLQNAIVHAQAMERLAKKKARHLLEEEMMKVSGGPCEGELKEKEDAKGEEETGTITREVTYEHRVDVQLQENVTAAALQRRIEYQDVEQEPAAEFQEMTDEQSAKLQEMMQQTAELQEMMQQQMAELQEMMRQQMEELREMMQRQMEETTRELQEQMSGSMEEMMSDLMDEMSESMKELLEESGLSDLMGSLSGSSEREMDPADFKMMKLKHRSEELRDLAKADAEYLKALFNKMAREKQSSLQSGFGSGNQGMNFGGAPVGGMSYAVGDGGTSTKTQIVQQINAAYSSESVSVSLPDAAMAPMTGGGFDISV